MSFGKMMINRSTIGWNEPFHTFPKIFGAHGSNPAVLRKNPVTFSEGRGGEANEGGGDVSDMDTSTDGFMDFKDEQ